MESRLLEHLPRRGPQVSLRAWRPADVDLMQRWLSPGHRWQELDGPYFARPSAEEVAAQAVEIKARVERGLVTSGDNRLAVVDRDDRLLGTVSRYLIDETGLLALGIVLFDEETWGRGLGREALGLWVDLVLTAWPDLHRVTLETWSGNRGMVRVAEVLGFTLEARHRESRLVGGERYDGLSFGMLRREWLSLRPLTPLAG